MANASKEPTAPRRRSGQTRLLGTAARRPELVRLEEVQTISTGVIGTALLLAGIVAILFAVRNDFPLPFFEHRYTVLLTVVFLAMAAYEIAVVRVHRRNFDFSKPRAMDQHSFDNIFLKFVGLTLSLAAAMGFYALLSEYHLNVSWNPIFSFQASWYRPFFNFFFAMSSLLLLAALPYFYICARYGRWSPDEDEILHVAHGYLALLRLRLSSAMFGAALRAHLVKFFFLPLMVGFYVENSAGFEQAFLRLISNYEGSSLKPSNVALLFDVANRGVFFLDVSLCVIGYACTARLFDTQIRSAEPTTFGWLVTLACYPPINRLTDVYLNYDETSDYWVSALAHSPVLYALFAVAIVLLLGVYVSSTVAFGLRFSNLTSRGILSKGPYGVVRHPAYISKNLSWWLISMPFLHNFGSCLRLLTWNLIYVARAITEERHLVRDPHYREYMQRVRHRFIPWIF